MAKADKLPPANRPSRALFRLAKSAHTEGVFEARKQLCTALFWLVGCDQPTPLAAPASLEAPSGALPSAAQLSPVFIEADIVQLQQIFLLNGLVSFEKAERWSKFYRQRWVRWSGQLSRINGEALSFRHFGGSGTYDVLLKTVRVAGRPPQEFKTGRFCNYIGRLERYDDGFQTLYLDQGVVRDAGADGVPGILVMPADQTRKLPGPPTVVPPTPPQ